MRITEHVRQGHEWQELRSYYWFPRHDVVETGPKWRTRKPCPGCGSNLTALAQREHECLGGRPEWPRLNNRRQVVQLRNNRAVLCEYVQTRGHDVQTD